MWRFVRRSGGAKAPPPDYYQEGLELAREEKHDEALTSFRLALRHRPEDPEVLQQMAIVYTRMGVTDEAIRLYRGVLARHPEASGAHYGLAFLLLKRGEAEGAREHLRSFLARPPTDPAAAEHVSFARQTLLELEARG